MSLILFFRLIVMSIFQQIVTHNKTNYDSKKMSYDNQSFYCPKVFAKDGFHISLQISRNNYCSSENGYRDLVHTFEEVEFGFPSEDDVMLHEYSEMYDCDNDNSNFTTVGTVGRIPTSVLEELFAKRGGIDWEKTISIEAFTRFINGR